MLSIEEARALYVSGDAAHDFDHVLRVMHLALRLARAEGADVEVVRLAALLHDVPVAQARDVVEKIEEMGAGVSAHTDNPQRAAHHYAAAAFARALLLARGLAEAKVQQVVHAIEAHRFRDQSIQPRTLEARCLYDADKLDSMGAIGIGRAFAYAGAHGNRLWTQSVPEIEALGAPPEANDYTPVHEYVYKLRRLQQTLHTATARALGAERHAFMQTFFSQIELETGDQ